MCWLGELILVYRAVVEMDQVTSPQLTPLVSPYEPFGGVRSSSISIFHPPSVYEPHWLENGKLDEPVAWAATENIWGSPSAIRRAPTTSIVDAARWRAP